MIEIRQEVERQINIMLDLNQEAKRQELYDNLFTDADLYMAGYAAALKENSTSSILPSLPIFEEVYCPIH